MGRSATEYTKLLQSLLPRGRVWTRDWGSVLKQVLHGQSDELSRVDGRSEDLVFERDTRNTNELLTDWERDLGLPDECSQDGATVSERRKEVNAKFTQKGRQDKQYFVDIALALGWTITITEYTPFICGVGVSGEFCGDSEVIFQWTINVNATETTIFFTSGSSESGDPLSELAGVETLICTMNRLKPAHTQLFFQFFGPGFSKGFNSGFDSIPSDIIENLTGGFGKGFSDGFPVAHGGGFSNSFSLGFSKQF